jgi:hypothetical protein
VYGAVRRLRSDNRERQLASRGREDAIGQVIAAQLEQRLTASTYRWDSTAQQYIYNWKTGTGGNYWRVGVSLDDAQTYYVNIGLR